MQHSGCFTWSDDFFFFFNTNDLFLCFNFNFVINKVVPPPPVYLCVCVLLELFFNGICLLVSLVL